MKLTTRKCYADRAVNLNQGQSDLVLEIAIENPFTSEWYLKV